MIKNILFDLDGTLFNFDECENLALMSSFKVYGKKISNDVISIYKKINSNLWEEYEKGLISREDVLEGRFEFLFNNLKINISPKQFNELYLYYLSGNFCLEYGALEILLNFKNKYRMYVVTNGVEKVQMKKMSGANLLHFFEDIFISENVGYSKPDKEFFKYCLDQMKAEPSECIIIGDSLLSDIKGGKNANIFTCWYNPEGKTKNVDIIPDYEIRQLIELKKILEV